MCNLSSTPIKHHSMPNYITLAWLKEHGALCRDALRWFEKTFPNGATLTEALAECTNERWIYWLLYQSSKDSV